MRVLEITLKNGKFVSTNNVNLEEFSDTYIKGNGWECSIKVNGAIKCKTIEEDSETKEEIYVIIYPNGSRQVKYRKNNEHPILLKKGYVVPEGVGIANGTLGVSDGIIKERHVFFRHEALQNFLREYGITKIIKANPNYIYQSFLAFNDNENHYANILTDGEEEIISNTPDEKENIKKRISQSSGLIVRAELIKIKNATWVLRTVRKRVGEKAEIHRTLYSLKNFRELNIPTEYKVE